MEIAVNPSRSDNRPANALNQRVAERRDVCLPARLTWKDQRGASRFASVVVRNASEIGVYVESQTPLALPLFRLVQCQLERDLRDSTAVPAALRQGRVLSAVYRVTRPAGPAGRYGVALRLMIDPKRLAAEQVPARATA
jgi:hypothetical protein